MSIYEFDLTSDGTIDHSKIIKSFELMYCSIFEGSAREQAERHKKDRKAVILIKDVTGWYVYAAC